MPRHLMAAILLQMDQPHISKQEILCFEYAIANKLIPLGVTREVSAALAMVIAGTVAAVIAAVDPGGTLRADVERWGGRLHIVRNTPGRNRRDVDHLVDRMSRSGLDTMQIATILEVPPEEVRRYRFRRNLPRHE